MPLIILLYITTIIIEASSQAFSIRSKPGINQSARTAAENSDPEELRRLSAELSADGSAPPSALPGALNPGEATGGRGALSAEELKAKRDRIREVLDFYKSLPSDADLVPPLPRQQALRPVRLLSGARAVRRCPAAAAAQGRLNPGRARSAPPWRRCPALTWRRLRRPCWSCRIWCRR